MSELDLTFPKLPMGTHQVPWDLKILLFKDAAKEPRKSAIISIEKGCFGRPIEDRIPLVVLFHEAISSLINLGKSRALVEANLAVLWRFFSWSDANSEHISRDTLIDIFKRWTEFQIYRSQISREISPIYAYRQSSKMADLITKALQLPGVRPGRNLVLQTRMRKPIEKKCVLSVRADKQNLEHTFRFGNALKKICDELDYDTVRAALPISIDVENEKTLLIKGNVKNPSLNPESMTSVQSKQYAEKVRAPIDNFDHEFDRYKRSGILNLRIECELLMFIAQTGMNLSQAAKVEREDFRWKSNGDDLEVFRVYKGRRGGEAIFRCYKAYRSHIERYLNWLDDVGYGSFDNRLFPLQSRAIIRVTGSKIGLYTSRGAFTKLDIPFINPSELRKTRVNWLLRRSRNLEMTALQMAHSKEVLLKDYERPHHQSAAMEIVQFHNASDPSFTPPGPGVCIAKGHKPESIREAPQEAPKPDCISPEGCLFCAKHRDIMSYEYCWKLASHSHIKSMETALYKPSNKQEVHPAYRVIDRIAEKLAAISTGSQTRAMWVKDAKDSIRAGRYHPYWDGHIKLLEVIV